MKIRNITIRLEEYETEDKLNESEKLLLEKANASLQNAYAPYSEFKVGAAVLLDNGEIVLGNNQENAAYPSGLCAERVALFQAKSVYPDTEIKAVAITAYSEHFHINHPITPCGGCRQVIAEVEGRQNKSIRIIMKGQTGAVHVVDGIQNLLPLMFKEEKLKRSKHRNK
jgi:cytidine deaminase